MLPSFARAGFARTATLGVAVAVAAGVAACSSAGSPDAQAFPLQVDSNSGALHADPEPPARGSNALELTITRTSDGAPVDGLSLEVEPWMPAMNHGTSAKPVVVSEGGGRYLVSELYLYMPGRWELRTTMTGPMTDEVTPALQIP